MLASVIANAAAALIKSWGGQSSRTFEPKDFLPEYWGEQGADRLGRADVDSLSPEVQVAFIELIAASMGAKDLRVKPSPDLSGN